ncbi:MAG: hypothetical protein NTX25_13230, partial [Proteobacteria bacterium]|nr:hypothetical protein [Pseudomonadota bacterium]
MLDSKLQSIAGTASKSKKTWPSYPTRLLWWTAPFWACALYFSTHHTAKALLASLALLNKSQVTQKLHTQEANPIETQRFIQQHYLSYGIYIPLDDIVIQGDGQRQPILTAQLQQKCGLGL